MVSYRRQVRAAQQTDSLPYMTHPNLSLISVIIPTCHRNDFLALCLDCLAPGVQSLPPEQYEVIVSDDGARSTAQQMVQEHYPWAKWVAGPRRGPAANRNHGASEAVGEWLAFTDDDCLPLPGWLEGYVQALDERVSVYEGKTTCAAGITSPLYQAPVNLTGGYLWSCNFLIRSSLFHDAGGFESDFQMPTIEDIDFYERLCQRGEQSQFVPAAIVDHPPRKIHSGRQTGKIYEAKVQRLNKQGHYGKSFIAYLQHLKHQLFSLRHFGLHPDLVQACWALVVEFFYVIPRLPGWEKKYQAQHQENRAQGRVSE